MTSQTMWQFEVRDTFHGTSSRGLLTSERFAEFMNGVAQTEDIRVVAMPVRGRLGAPLRTSAEVEELVESAIYSNKPFFTTADELAILEARDDQRFADPEREYPTYLSAPHDALVLDGLKRINELDAAREFRAAHPLLYSFSRKYIEKKFLDERAELLRRHADELTHGGNQYRIAHHIRKIANEIAGEK